MTISCRTFPGGANTDVLTSSTTISLTDNLRSWCAWVNISSLDATRRRIAHAESGNNGDEYDLDNTNGFHTLQGFSGGYAGWKASTAFPTTGSWLFIALAFDGSSASNTPSIWFGNTAQSVTNFQASSGSLGTGSVGNQYIGNRGDGTRCFNGSIAMVARWEGYQLVQADVDQLAAGVAPCAIHLAYLFGYYPLDAGNSPEPDLVYGNNATVTGTTVGTGPSSVTTPRCQYGMTGSASTSGIGTLPPGISVNL